MVALSSELRAWIEPVRAGVIMVVDTGGLPRVTRLWAPRVLDGDVIEMHVQRAASAPVLEALELQRRAAVNLIDVTTYRSRLFRGTCERLAGPIETGFVEAGLVGIEKVFNSVGLVGDCVDRMLAHGDPPREMVALRLTVEQVFDQSPKPGAGARL